MIFTAIRWGGVQNVLWRLFRLPAGDTVPTLAPEVQPSFEIGSACEPENYVLRGDRLAAMVGGSTGAASQAYVQLTVPNNSNLISVIERIFVCSSANDAFDIRYGSTTSTAGLSGNRQSRDSRWFLGGSSPLPATQLRTGASAAADIADTGTLGGQFRILANTVVEITLPAVLAVGAGVNAAFNANLLIMQTSNGANNLTVVAHVRERFANPNELNAAT